MKIPESSANPLSPCPSPPIKRELALLLVTVFLCAIPFLGQPFHMDDCFYLDMARNALRKPLFPNDTPYVFEGRPLPDMGSHSHPPLQTYFLAAVLRVAGEAEGNEWIYHCCALVYPALAAVSMYFLCLGLCARPLWPALALVCAPLFGVMQHNLMTDLPALAFWLASISTFVWAVRLRRTTLFAASSVFQFAALFTSYHSLALAPLLGFYLVRKRGPKAGWFSLAAPLLVMAAWFGMNAFHYHRFLLIDTAGYMGSRNALTGAAISGKLIAVLQVQGWLIVFPLFAVCVFSRGLRGRACAAVLVLSAYGACLLVSDYRPVDKVIFALGLAAGLSIFIRAGFLALASFAGRKEPAGLAPDEGRMIALWYFGAFGLCLFLFTEGSARYALPLVPPVLILLFRDLEAIEIAEYCQASAGFLHAGAIAGGTVVVTLAWALALGHADLEFARTYPRLARQFAGMRGGLPAYHGGEWGFRHYMERAGVPQIPVDENQVRGGSLLALPKLALPYELPAALRDMMVPVSSTSAAIRSPFRLLAADVPAAFYSTGWGLLPFSLSREDPEGIEVSQVHYLVAELPDASITGGREVKPWPGYVNIDGEKALALLVPAGATIVYPWKIDVPARLEVRCALAPGYGQEEGGDSDEFEVRQLDADGQAMASERVSIAPGGSPGRHWQRLTLPLEAGGGSKTSVALSFGSGGNASGRVGAFAAPLIRALNRSQATLSPIPRE